MTMRPWNQTTPNITQSDQWSMGDYSWRRSCNAPVILAGQREACRMLPLCFAVKRKLSNLFAEIDAENTGLVTEGQVMRAFSAGLDLADGAKRTEHEAAVAEWWKVLRSHISPPPSSSKAESAASGADSARSVGDGSSSAAQGADDAALSGSSSSAAGDSLLSPGAAATPPPEASAPRSEGISSTGGSGSSRQDAPAAMSKEVWLLVFMQIFSSDAAVSTEDLPSWLMTPSLSRFRLAKKATEGQMTLQEWEDWQTASHRLSLDELSKRTKMGSTGGGAPATLKDLFAAADAGRKGHITEMEYTYIVRRWWRCTEHWDELLDYSLP